MLGKKSEFTGVTGIGQVLLECEPDQQVYTFIGANGVGKTKILEALFQVLFFSHTDVKKLAFSFKKASLRFKHFSTTAPAAFTMTLNASEQAENILIHNIVTAFQHNNPVLFLGAQARGNITEQASHSAVALRNPADRKQRYLQSIVDDMENRFAAMNMGPEINQWFVSIAQSLNPYQKQEDNRGIEITTVLKILHEIDERIDASFLEIDGDEHVSLKISGCNRGLSQLSSGFSSIIKLVQVIVSGYGYFTNEQDLQQVKGIVLIDEIESHLHLSWQANIIPLFKRLFPNTTFYITTHSSVVLSQLQEGEAYQLYHDDNEGITKTTKIASPNNAALVDILKDVFHLDINQMKINNSNAEQQKQAKNQLLSLITEQGIE